MELVLVSVLAPVLELVLAPVLELVAPVLELVAPVLVSELAPPAGKQRQQ